MSGSGRRRGHGRERSVEDEERRGRGVLKTNIFM